MGPSRPLSKSLRLCATTVSALDWLLVEPGAFYVMDRGYVDYARLYQMHQAGAYFVVRAKEGLNFVRHQSRAVDRSTGLRSDHLGRFRGFYSYKRFPEKLRVVHFFDAEQERHFRFLTNHQQFLAELLPRTTRQNDFPSSDKQLILFDL